MAKGNGGKPRGGKWGMAAKITGALAGVTVLGYAATKVFAPKGGVAKGLVVGGAGFVLATLLGLFKGTRKYVPYALGGSVAAGVLAGASDQVTKTGDWVADLLTGKGKPGDATARKDTGAGGGKDTGSGAGSYKPAAGRTMDAEQVVAVQPKKQKVDKTSQYLQFGESLANLGGAIAGAIGRGGGGVAGSVGIDDFSDITGAEGIDDFSAIEGAGMDDIDAIADAISR